LIWQGKGWEEGSQPAQAGFASPDWGFSPMCIVIAYGGSLT